MCILQGELTYWTHSTSLLLQLVLILLNAFFVATEIAIVSLNEKKVKARADDGNKKAINLLKIIKEPTKFLSTIQIGVTLAGFLGSAFAADNFSKGLFPRFLQLRGLFCAKFCYFLPIIFFTTFFTAVIKSFFTLRIL